MENTTKRIKLAKSITSGTCTYCAETLNNKNYRVTCCYCSIVSCVTCLKNEFQRSDDIFRYYCPDCKNSFPRQFMLTNFSKSFVDKTLVDLKKDSLFAQFKTMLANAKKVYVVASFKTMLQLKTLLLQ